VENLEIAKTIPLMNQPFNRQICGSRYPGKLWATRLDEDESILVAIWPFHIHAVPPCFRIGRRAVSRWCAAFASDNQSTCKAQ